MSVLGRATAFALALLLLAAAGVPCPPAGLERVDHGDHLHEVVPALADDGATLASPCACGCGERAGAALFAGRLGFAEAARDFEDPPSAAGWAPLALAEPRLPPAPSLGADAVPI